MSDYDAFMDSAAWQERRAHVMIRARGWCEECGTRPARMVHHLTYATMRHEPDEDLLAMCHRCHQRRHKPRPQPPNQSVLW